MILGMTIEEIVAYVFIGWVILIAVGVAFKYFAKVMDKRPELKDANFDLVSIAYKSRRLAAKTNKRRINKFLLLTSDQHLPEIRYKFFGAIHERTCSDIFWKPKFWISPRWVVVPNELLWDWHCRNVRIDARDFIEFGDRFWVPVITAHRPGKRRYFREIICDHILEILTCYTFVISTKNRFNVVATAHLATELEKYKVVLQAYKDGEEQTEDGVEE